MWKVFPTRDNMNKKIRSRAKQECHQGKCGRVNGDNAHRLRSETNQEFLDIVDQFSSQLIYVLLGLERQGIMRCIDPIIILVFLALTWNFSFSIPQEIRQLRETKTGFPQELRWRREHKIIRLVLIQRPQSAWLSSIIIASGSSCCQVASGDNGNSRSFYRRDSSFLTELLALTPLVSQFGKPPLHAAHIGSFPNRGYWVLTNPVVFVNFPGSLRND